VSYTKSHAEVSVGSNMARIGTLLGIVDDI